MAQSRIINYDGTYVTYYYERHEDGKRIEETIHVYEFIKLLIKHIPDKNFKVVRYYGILVSFLMFSSEDFEDEDWTFDEEWEDKAEKFYNQGNNKSNNSNPINDDNLPF